MDQLSEQIQRELLIFMLEDRTAVPRAMRTNSVAAYLERVADRATNIAEMVIFLVQGKDIRHRASAKIGVLLPLAQ